MEHQPSLHEECYQEMCTKRPAWPGICIFFFASAGFIAFGIVMIVLELAQHYTGGPVVLGVGFLMALVLGLWFYVVFCCHEDRTWCPPKHLTGKGKQRQYDASCSCIPNEEVHNVLYTDDVRRYNVTNNASDTRHAHTRQSPNLVLQNATGYSLNERDHQLTTPEVALGHPPPGYHEMVSCL